MTSGSKAVRRELHPCIYSSDLPAFCRERSLVFFRFSGVLDTVFIYWGVSSESSRTRLFSTHLLEDRRNLFLSYPVLEPQDERFSPLQCLDIVVLQ